MEVFPPILQVGAVGGCLVWFMLRLTPMVERMQAEIRRHSDHIDALSTMMGLAALANNGLSVELKRQLERALADLAESKKKQTTT